MRSTGTATDTPYDAQDLATEPGVWLVFKAGQILIAAFFLLAQPLWMPLAWLGLVWICEIAHFCVLKIFRTSLASKERLASLEKVAFYASFTALGSSAYFLYVPNNLAMQGVLAVCLVTIGALSVMRFAGNNLRGSLGAALVILPGSVRLLTEGQWIQALMGVGGFLVVLALTLLGKKQETALVEQATLRRRAEDAVDAVATVGLAKARFFAAVSHDLRQPVHAIGLYLAPLLGQVVEERHKKALDGIYQSWQALDDLLSQVLDLTRMDTGNFQTEINAVELAPLIRGLVVQHSAAAEKKGIRIVAMAPVGRCVWADLLMLKRVLSNLLDNAIKFSPEDARIAIAVRSVGAQWCVQVRDSGRGIALAAQTQVFEEFVQLDNPERDRAQGMGLGLAIAKRFVDLMQGQLSLRSALGAGTCMSVFLAKAWPPQQDFTVGGKHALGEQNIGQPSMPVHVSLGLRDALMRSGKALLLVEDDDLVAHAIEALLGDLQLPVVRAIDAQQALSMLPLACMAACDVRLPGSMTGVDLAIQLQQQGIPALLMTGETSAEVRAQAQAHHLQLLIKPVKPQVLLDAFAALSKASIHQT